MPLVEPNRYQYVCIAEGDDTPPAIQLLDKEYKGFTWIPKENIKIEPIEDDSTENMVSFQYDIIDMGVLFPEDLEKTEFKTLLGNIVVDILENIYKTNPDNLILAFPSVEE